MDVLVDFPASAATYRDDDQGDQHDDAGLVIAVVDDQVLARTILCRELALVDGVASLHAFADADEALQWCANNEADLVVVDYRMPLMDGLELVRSLKMLPGYRHTPMILVSVDADEHLHRAALDAGINDVIAKPVQPRELRTRCSNLLQLRSESRAVQSRLRELEVCLRDSVEAIESRERETLVRLARAIEFRDAGTSAYLERMSRIAALIASEMGLSQQEVRIIEAAAPLHDLGKIAIPDSVLLKPGKLDEDELAIMRRHPMIGQELLAGSQNRAIQMAAAIALGHHERFDGSGYPNGVAGEQIPLEARIVAVADVLDALLSPRPYKDAWSVEDALGYLVKQSGRHFDPACVDALLRRRADVESICREHSTAFKRPGI